MDRAISIPLSGGHVAFVDEGDAVLVSGIHWKHRRSRGSTLYAIQQIHMGSKTPRVFVYMHRKIMQPPPGMSIDHVNGNGLDNRRQNLRICTHAQNMQNKRRQRSDQFKGVTPRPSGAYQARIDSKYLGSFPSEIEAALAYDRAAKKMYGEFACLNFPDDVSVVPHALHGGDEADQCRHNILVNRPTK